MLSTRSNKWHIVAAAAFLSLLLAAGCSPTGGDGQQSGTSPPPQVAATSADPWFVALNKTPFPYLLALPEPRRTAVDGTYTRVELKDTPPVHCLRCPDYAAEGGIWKLNLDRGIFHIFHQATGWQSNGSFVVTRDRWTAGAPDQLLLFNDPTCPDAIGLYRWRLEGRDLVLEVIDDTCAIYLRAARLTSSTWLSCQPPDVEAGITDHWAKPPGCD